MTGRFVVERCLGNGSMGAVYLAFDRVRGSKVALKTLSRVDGSGIYRFKREFRALADVSHPNLVELHELFSEGNYWFFTMEYVQGQDFLS
jgi:serine/threonine protein kinase